MAALGTIRFSLTTHRGCYGECRFCAIAVHQGRQVISRSEASLLREAAALTRHPGFKGIISDLGGPTANMYAMGCNRKKRRGACRDRSCLLPEPCPGLKIDHSPQIHLLRALRRIAGIRKVFIGSGIRSDLIMNDRRAGEQYLAELVRHHVSGQLKIAPEHIAPGVLNLMGKPGPEDLEAFIRRFQTLRQKYRQNVFLTYYLMAAHPGCSLADMQTLRNFAVRKLHLLPEQVQIFTPAPSTYATLMYHTEIDPFSGCRIFVEKTAAGRQRQKNLMTKGRRL